MKNLFIILLTIGGSLMAQPPLPAVDDGIVITPIDQLIVLPILLGIGLFYILLKKKKKAIS